MDPPAGSGRLTGRRRDPADELLRHEVRSSRRPGAGSPGASSVRYPPRRTPDHRAGWSGVPVIQRASRASSHSAACRGSPTRPGRPLPPDVRPTRPTSTPTIAERLIDPGRGRSARRRLELCLSVATRRAEDERLNSSAYSPRSGPGRTLAAGDDRRLRRPPDGRPARRRSRRLPPRRTGRRARPRGRAGWPAAPPAGRPAGHRREREPCRRCRPRSSRPQARPRAGRRSSRRACHELREVPGGRNVTGHIRVPRRIVEVSRASPARTASVGRRARRTREALVVIGAEKVSKPPASARRAMAS